MLLLVGGIMVLVVPTVTAFIFYMRSFKIPVYLCREVGEDTDDAVIKLYWAKKGKKAVLGRTLRFKPLQGPGLEESKLYPNHYFTRMVIGKKSYEGIILYQQGSNYRPVTLIQKDNYANLVVEDEDNRDFMIDREIITTQKRGYSTSMVVVAMFIFGCVLLGYGYFTFQAFMTSGDITQYIEGVYRAASNAPVVLG